MLDKVMKKIAQDETVKERVGSEELLKEAAVFEQDLINQYKVAEQSEAALVEEFLGKYSAGNITANEINEYDKAVIEAQTKKVAAYDKLAELYDHLITDEQREELKKESALEEAYLAGCVDMAKEAGLGDVLGKVKGVANRGKELITGAKKNRLSKEIDEADDVLEGLLKLKDPKGSYKNYTLDDYDSILDKLSIDDGSGKGGLFQQRDDEATKVLLSRLGLGTSLVGAGAGASKAYNALSKESAVQEAFIAGALIKKAQTEELDPGILDAILQWIQENPEVAGSLLGGGLGAGLGMSRGTTPLGTLAGGGLGAGLGAGLGSLF